MSYRLDGTNPLSYQGVLPTTPAQMIVMQRAPTVNDYIGYPLGTQWVYYIKDDPSTSVQYFLSSVANNVGVWVTLNQSGDNPTLPIHSVVLGTGVPGFTSTGPIATLGAPLVSDGTGSDPFFGVASVSGGGTGLNDCDPYSVYCGGTTGEGPVQQVAGLGSAGQVLTSQGNGSLPIWSTSGGGSSGGPIKVQTFDLDGTYTMTAGTGSLVVEIIGGGGGGSGGLTTGMNQYIVGGGGAGGAYSRKLFQASEIIGPQAVSIGAGGNGGDNADPGEDGEDTTFGILMTAGGGLGSPAGTADFIALGGAGQVATGGDLNVIGQAGNTANVSSEGSDFTITLASGGNGIYGASGGTQSFKFDNTETTALGGLHGFQYGGGGGGGIAVQGSGGTPTSAAGGDGKSGLCIVTEFGPYGILPPVSGTTINIIVYDTPGAGVYTPSVNCQQVLVECQGGGGAAAGFSFASSNSFAGSGSGYCKKLFSRSDLGATENYFIGAGGLSTTMGFGNDGEDTTFSSGMNLMTGGKGIGGISNPPAFYTPGGVATGGSVNIPGEANGLWLITNSGGSVTSRAGGGSFLGFGGASLWSSGTNYPGKNGTGYGSGGGGPTFAAIGGNGASGVIIITEYIS